MFKCLKIMPMMIFYLLIGLFLVACQENKDISYDHEQSLITTDKAILTQHKRTILFQEDSLSFSNEFSGARMNDAYKIGEKHYRVHIEPENSPINKSPWYAFQIISSSPRTIEVELKYHNTIHRYQPKISSNGKDWNVLDTLKIQRHDSISMVTLQLDLISDTTWVSAGELITSSTITQWIGELQKKYPYIHTTTLGMTSDGNPLHQLQITQANSDQVRGVLIIIGRQHPPEVSGQLAIIHFINKICDNSRLSRMFRDKFEILAIPMANPDGVHRGHWRHNAKGVDLNRDWNTFNQIESQAIRSALTPLSFDPLRKVYYSIDFHSTNEYILYPSSNEIPLFPSDFTNQWLIPLLAEFDDLPYKIELGELKNPVFRNWINKLFKADGITFEFYDEFNRKRLQEFSEKSAEFIMQALLDTYQQQ